MDYLWCTPLSFSVGELFFDTQITGIHTERTTQYKSLHAMFQAFGILIAINHIALQATVFFAIRPDIGIMLLKSCREVRSAVVA
jgi:uncharacterized membrane protein